MYTIKHIAHFQMCIFLHKNRNYSRVTLYIVLLDYVIHIHTCTYTKRPCLCMSSALLNV